MPVPSNITDLSTTESSNSPAGSETAKGVVDNYFRAHAKFIRQNYNDITAFKGASGSSLIGFQQAGTGSVVRTSEDKQREGFSVKDFGTTFDGVADNTSTFSLAAQAALAASPQSSDYAAMPSSDWCTVEIPAGRYKLTGYVDTGNREVVWRADNAAVIDGVEYLNGRLERAGSKVSDFHHGILDAAASFAVMANRSNDEQSQVSGFTNPNQLSKGNGRDTVGLYVSNKVPAALYGAAAVTSYTATTVNLSTPLTSDQLKKMRRGMIVQTRHAPQKYAGIVDSFTAASITVKDGWFLVDGSAAGTPTTPPGTDGLDINGFRTAWAGNSNVFIGPESYGTGVYGWEFGVQNTKGAPSTQGGGLTINGVYSVNLSSSTYPGDHAFVAAGDWTNGFTSYGSVKNAFRYDGTKLPGTALDNLLIGTGADGKNFYQVTTIGSTEAGIRGAAASITYDFHSGASDTDYDSRILATGGDGTAGGGTLALQAKALQLGTTGTTITLNGVSTEVANAFRPASDGAYALGQSARRFSNVYAQNIVLSPPASATPANNGELVFQLTSNTQLTIRVKGSDGTVRSVNLTLA